MIIFCTVQILFFLSFLVVPITFISFFISIFSLNLISATLTATGEGLTGYITKKKNKLVELKRRKVELMSPEKKKRVGAKLRKRKDNEDGIEIGYFIVILGCLINLFKYFGSLLVGVVEWKWICLTAAIISPTPLLIYTLVVFKEEKVNFRKKVDFCFFTFI